MRQHKLEIMLKDRKIGKSDRKIGSDFEKKKDRIGKSDRQFFWDRPITNRKVKLQNPTYMDLSLDLL